MLAPDVVTKLPNVFFAVKHKNRLFPPPRLPNFISREQKPAERRYLLGSRTA